MYKRTKLSLLSEEWGSAAIAGLLLLALSVPCLAKRPLRILYYQSPQDAPSEACLYAGESMVSKVELPRFNFSKTVEIPAGEQVLRFLPNELGEGEAFSPDAPHVDIPADWQKVLLLVFADEKNEVMPIRVRAINASDNVFGPGKVYLMNFSKILIGGTIGDQKVNLKPRDFRVVSNPISGEGYYPVKLFSLVKPGDEPRRFIKQMWKHSDADRQLVFILPKPAPTYATYYCAPIRDF